MSVTGEPIETVSVDEIIAEVLAEAAASPVYRRSIKYKIVPSKTRLIMDYVFADNPEEAAERAIERLELPADEPFEIFRVNESSGVTGSAIKGVKHKYGTV